MLNEVFEVMVVPFLDPRSEPIVARLRLAMAAVLVLLALGLHVSIITFALAIGIWGYLAFRWGALTIRLPLEVTG